MSFFVKIPNMSNMIGQNSAPFSDIFNWYTPNSNGIWDTRKLSKKNKKTCTSLTCVNIG